jgi:hypothetical protein
LSAFSKVCSRSAKLMAAVCSLKTFKTNSRIAVGLMLRVSSCFSESRVHSIVRQRCTLRGSTLRIQQLRPSKILLLHVLFFAVIAKRKIFHAFSFQYAQKNKNDHKE